MIFKKIKKLLWPIFIPGRYKRFYCHFSKSAFNMLDVGCANNSTSLVNFWFPKVKYFGLDEIEFDKKSPERKLMNGFFCIDLEKIERLEDVPDNFFDAIVVSHVIEHVGNGLAVLAILCNKLKPTGYIYVEYPSARSLKFPHMRGTLNFNDDPGHKSLYHTADIILVFSDKKVNMISCGLKRDWVRVFLTPVVCVYQKLRYGFVYAGALWDLAGFADFVWGRKEDV
jgi:SAM-dependent methyltransferase